MIEKNEITIENEKDLGINDYNADSIKVLKELEGVRKRPSMYIGNTYKEGRHHLVWEIIDNSIDEALAGFCKKINISINTDSSITIEDNGRGIPVEIHKEYNLPALEVIVLNLHSGGKFDKKGYKISGGLHGVGLSVVAALSEWILIEVVRNGKYYYQTFSRGKKASELKSVSLIEFENLPHAQKFLKEVTVKNNKEFQKKFDNKVSNNNRAKTKNKNKNKDEDGKEDLNGSNTDENYLDLKENGDYEQNQGDIDFHFELGINPNVTGTRITFLPDQEIFQNMWEEESVFDFDLINNRVRDLAYLNPTLQIQIYDWINGKYAEHYYEGGISEFVEYLNRGNKVLFTPPINITDKINEVEVDISFQYSESHLENIFSFVNNVNTIEGGTHLTSFKTALTRVLNQYLQQQKNKKEKDIQFQGSDVREGLTAVVSIKLPNPQFEGQTKTKLGNEEVAGIVSNVLSTNLSRYLEEHPNIAEKILEKCLMAYKSRIAAKKAREAIRRKGALDSHRLPGKLADCSSQDPSKSELFIVEGDSAGGSAKQGRDRDIQAVLPLRGKILNVEKSSQHKMFDNKEIKSLISAIGTGIYTSEESEFKIENLRYHKIIIMCDADVDGHHIETLLLTFFFRYMRPLIEKGYVYIAIPPLYKVSYKKELKYLYNEQELSQYLSELKNKYNIDENNHIKVQRFKGLGEMNPEELWETTMNPLTRKLKRITYSDYAETHQMFSTLMGDEVLPRKQYIIDHYNDTQNIDI